MSQATVPSGNRRAGRPAALTREAVLDAALRLLDDVGLDGFSMRGLGARLGVDPMAVYHYFANRTELLDGVVERVFAEFDPPALTGRWMADVAAFTHAFRETLLAHPAAIPLIAMRPAVTLPAFDATEALLEALAPAGLPPRAALDAAQMLGRMTTGHVAAQAGPPPGADRDGREAAHAASAAALPAARFPRIAAAYAEGYVIDHDALFAQAVDAALASVERSAQGTGR